MWEETEIYHHGIKGQKWGVRRYQNPDGSLTSAGKKRIKNISLEEKFNIAEKQIKRNLTNEYSNFVKKTVSIKDVKDRSGLNDIDATHCISLSMKKFNEAYKLEPEITKDVVNSVKLYNCKMYGLENRLKQPTSMAGKIGSDSKEKNISFEDASKGIKDAIRYTVISNDEKFVTNYNLIKNSLIKKGYIETRCKNYFDMYNKGESMHKSVQCVYQNKDGYNFELQFQTLQSQAAKELKIPIYEERRKVGISAQRALKLESDMRDLAEKVKDPKNISSIKSK